MAMPTWVPDAWNRLSEDNQKQVGSFMQFLLSQQDSAMPDTRAKERRLGSLADRFEFIADDFNDPIDEFREYM